MRPLNPFQPGAAFARRASSPSRKALCRPLAAIVIVFAGWALCAGAQDAAKPAAGSTAAGQHPRSHRHAATPAPVPAVPLAQEPQVPEMPHWPQNDAPAEPAVTWDSHGLHIAAANSSLQQVLNAVASATGAKVEGLVSDERVFGDYGPGQARDVLSQLLHGSGYNVLMIGDRGQGTPREIVLSARRSDTRPHQPNQSQNPDAQDEEQPEPPEPEEPPQNLQQNLQPPGMNVPPGAPRTPQQMLQELQQRQQQMQDQQQQPH